MKKYRLSVCIRAYNQEMFIAQAVESALMQITTFPFEIIISDDCSTDSTLRIISDYSLQYPDIVKVIAGEINIGGTANLKRVLEASTSKYVALCDGDDFWTDSFKLEKQVRFLDSHPEYVVCFHNVIKYWEDSKSKPILFNSLDFPNHHTYKSLVEFDWFLPICSEVFVREKLFFPKWYDTVMNDDYVVNLMLALSGPFYYMPDLMAVYRLNDNSESNNYSDKLLLNRNLKFILEKTRDIYPSDSSTIFDKKIEELDEKIKLFEIDAKYPYKRYLRLKFYKKIIANYLNISRKR